MAEAGRPTITDLGHGRFRIFDGDRYRLAWAAGPPTARWVFYDGRVYLIADVSGGGAATRSTHDDMALTSPMPATVISVKVVPGQTVKQGDVLIMLEAMKMELPVTAPHDGRVKAVACKPGDLVQPGVSLVELE